MLVKDRDHQALPPSPRNSAPVNRGWNPWIYYWLGKFHFGKLNCTWTSWVASQHRWWQKQSISPNLQCAQKLPEGLLKHGLLGLVPRVSDSIGLAREQESVFWTSSQVTLPLWHHTLRTTGPMDCNFLMFQIQEIPAGISSIQRVAGPWVHGEGQDRTRTLTTGHTSPPDQGPQPQALGPLFPAMTALPRRPCLPCFHFLFRLRPFQGVRTFCLSKPKQKGNTHEWL